jgi:H+/Cl- antiporter ClcA
MGSEGPSRQQRLRRAILVVAVVGLLVFAAGWVFYQYAPRQTPQGQPALVELPAGELGAFTAAFNAASTSVRVVLMLSPT